jgi:hypothetical protein
MAELAAAGTNPVARRSAAEAWCRRTERIDNAVTTILPVAISSAALEMKQF